MFINDQYEPDATATNSGDTGDTGSTIPADVAAEPAAAPAVAASAPPRDGGTYSFDPATGQYTRIA